MCLLPVRRASFDAAVCIAVLHHISSEERRRRLVAECMRAVRVGGEALFYAWAQEQHQPRGGNGEEGGKTGGVDGGDGGDGQNGGAVEAVEGVSGHRFAEQDVLVPYHVKAGGGGGAAEAAAEAERAQAS